MLMAFLECLGAHGASHLPLTLARDPLGMKPLYYANLPAGQGFAFASEVKAFLPLSGFRVEVNRTALRQFLEFGYTFDERATSLRGVYKLPPGHRMEVSGGTPEPPQSYFAPPAPEADSGGITDARVDELFETLSTVVAQHLVADVPVGMLLSGGLDSRTLRIETIKRLRKVVPATNSGHSSGQVVA